MRRRDPSRTVSVVPSATDGQLKPWNVNKAKGLRSFKGHINEKKSVGLAYNGDYVDCGECEERAGSPRTLKSVCLCVCLLTCRSVHPSVSNAEHACRLS